MIGPLLGSGSAGVVYEATDRHSGVSVAVKVVSGRNQVITDRAIQEAELSWSLNHPHVVRVLRWGRLKAGVYLVMEHLEGESLSTRLHRRGTLPIREVVEIGRQLARALVAVHARGALHRDVKPSNIFVSPPAEGTGSDAPHVKLLDLGLVRLAEADPARRVRTEQGAMLGTPGYLSPEQILGGQVSPRTDLWCLGATLHRAATGEFAFGPGDRLAVLHRLAGATEPPVLDPSLPQPFRDLLLRLLHPDPAARIDRASALQSILDALAGNEQTSFESTTVRVGVEPLDQNLELPTLGDEAAMLRFQRRVVATIAQAFRPGHLPGDVQGLLDDVDRRVARIDQLEEAVKEARREAGALEEAVEARERLLEREREAFEDEVRAHRDAVLRVRLELRNINEHLGVADEAYRAAYASLEEGEDAETLEQLGEAHASRGRLVASQRGARERLVGTRRRVAESFGRGAQVEQLRSQVEADREGRLAEAEVNLANLEGELDHARRASAHGWIELALRLRDHLGE